MQDAETQGELFTEIDGEDFYFSKFGMDNWVKDVTTNQRQGWDDLAKQLKMPGNPNGGFSLRSSEQLDRLCIKSNIGVFNAQTFSHDGMPLEITDNFARSPLLAARFDLVDTPTAARYTITRLKAPRENGQGNVLSALSGFSVRVASWGRMSPEEQNTVADIMLQHGRRIVSSDLRPGPVLLAFVKQHYKEKPEEFVNRSAAGMTSMNTRKKVADSETAVSAAPVGKSSVKDCVALFNDLPENGKALDARESSNAFSLAAQFYAAAIVLSVKGEPFTASDVSRYVRGDGDLTLGFCSKAMAEKGILLAERQKEVNGYRLTVAARPTDMTAEKLVNTLDHIISQRYLQAGAPSGAPGAGIGRSLPTTTNPSGNSSQMRTEQVMRKQIITDVNDVDLFERFQQSVPKTAGRAAPPPSEATLTWTTAEELNFEAKQPVPAPAQAVIASPIEKIIRSFEPADEFLFPFWMLAERSGKNRHICLSHYHGPLFSEKGPLQIIGHVTSLLFDGLGCEMHLTESRKEYGIPSRMMLIEPAVMPHPNGHARTATLYNDLKSELLGPHNETDDPDNVTQFDMLDQQCDTVGRRHRMLLILRELSKGLQKPAL